jgi:sortase A
MTSLKRLAPVLQWFGCVLSLGAAAGLVVLAVSFLAPPVALQAASTHSRASLANPAALAAALPPTASPTDAPVASPTVEPSQPVDLWIPALDLRAPVVAITPREIDLGSQRVAQLDVPNAFAAGWNALSAPVGLPGNTVLVGHNNEFGEVFRNLDRLAVGDEIMLFTGASERRYLATEVVTLPEEARPLADRLANAAWIAPSADERLTLVTCWPYFTNTHRLVVVAHPVD